MEQLIVLTLVFSTLFAFPVGVAIMLVNAYERGRRQPRTGTRFFRWKTRWLVLAVASALLVSARTDSLSAALISPDLGDRLLVYHLSAYNAAALRGESSVPDTVEAGMQAARIDLQHGIRRFMVYGLAVDPPSHKTKPDDFEILHGGCLTGGKGYTFWMGYNHVMGAEAKRLYGADIPSTLDPPPVVTPGSMKLMPRAKDKKKSSTST